MIKKALFFLMLFSCGISMAQLPPTVEWKKSYGSLGEERAYAIQQTFDGGFIVAGSAGYNSGDVTGDHTSGTADFWVVKLSATGVIQWQKCYGGSGDDIAYSIQQCKDSGYIVTGSTLSPDGDVIGFTADHNNSYWGSMWTIKISKTGVLEWQKLTGGQKPGFSESHSAIQTKDNGFVVSGLNYHAGAYNGTVVKLSDTGSVQWQATANCIIYSIQQTTDNGYIVAGGQQVLGLILNKMDSSGNQQWLKYYGGFGYYTNQANSVIQTPDGGYIVAGVHDATDTSISGIKGGLDVWVVKVDSIGNVEWQNLYGGRRSDVGNSIKLTADGGYIIAGTSDSFDGDVQNVNPALIDTSGAIHHPNLWMFKINNLGVIQWQKTMGGNNDDAANAIQQTTDGGYIAAGYVVSNILNNADINGTGFHFNPTLINATGHDFFVVKFGKESVAPVILSSFTATVANENALLTWQTNSELNNSYFEIQKSKNGIDFSAVGIINGSGTSDLIHNYTFTDNNFWQQGSGYYRLKQVDIDGSFTYSNIKYLRRSKEENNILVFPNPANNYFNLTIPDNYADVLVNIYDTKSALIIQKNCKAGTTLFNSYNWVSGEYLIEINSNNGKEYKKIIILK